MRSLLTIGFAAIFGLQSAFAQVSKIEQKSKENNSPPPSNSGSSGSSSGSSGGSGSGSNGNPKQENNSSQDNSYYYYNRGSSSYSSGGTCQRSYDDLDYSIYESTDGLDGCACFDWVKGIADAQRRLVNQKDNPMATSVELMPHVAYGSMRILSYIPRIRATYGIFSTDFRITSLNDVSEVEQGIYYTYDWQILQLNLLNDKNVGFYAGGGLLMEHTSTTKNNFFEFSLGLLIRELGPWSGAIEYRNSGYSDTGIKVRKEGSARINYAFMERKPFYVNLTAGTIFQNYYQSIPVWSGLGGFTLVLK